jgi:DNA-binding transcriptional MerR regulator
VDEIRYLEAKGFIRSSRVRLLTRSVRAYKQSDITKVQTIIKYRHQGYTWGAAYERATKEMENPTLL